MPPSLDVVRARGTPNDDGPVKGPPIAASGATPFALLRYRPLGFVNWTIISHDVAVHVADPFLSRFAMLT